MARIFISPLDWGLGHATRMIPVISWLRDNGHEVILGTYGESGIYLKKEFPDLNHVALPGFTVIYPRNNYFFTHLTFQLPNLLQQYYQERNCSRKLFRELKPDLIISDNRYGVRDDNVPSVIITHQTNILTPALLNPVVASINHSLLSRFDECWIPDLPDSKYSGSLSGLPSPKIRKRYIGLLSSVSGKAKTARYDICVLVSGPEPQRSLFQAKILDFLRSLKKRKIALITTSEFESSLSESITVFKNASRAIVQNLLLESSLLISRPGYSTIMDAAGTGLKALFIPTPGQSEQEYLGRALMEKNISLTVEQHESLKEELIDQALMLKGFTDQEDKMQFTGALKEILKTSEE